MTIHIDNDASLDSQEVQRKKEMKSLQKILLKMAEDLTDMSRRNPQLNFKITSGYTFDLSKANQTVFGQLLAGRTVALNKLFSVTRSADDDFEDGIDPESDDEVKTKSGVLTTARKAFQKSKEMEEEKGLEVFYLAQYGISWTGQDSREYLAPLILTPATITRQGESGYNIFIDSSGGSMVNPSLIDYLQVNFKADLDVEEVNLAASEVAIADNSKFARDFFKEVKVWLPKASFSELKVLSVFQFATLPMVQDLKNPEFLELAFENEVIQSITGVGGEWSLVSGEEPVDFESLDREPASEMKLVLDADSHQQIAIKTALRGDHLVIQGPPGTGKSQTITNLICELVSNGKTVLFVAEKAAAINAVSSRLDNLDLGHVMLKLHESGGKKKVAYDQLTIAENLGKKVVDHDRDFSRLEESRGRLLERNRALYDEKSHYGYSIFELLEASYAVPALIERKTLDIPTNFDSAAKRLLSSRGMLSAEIAKELAKKNYLSEDSHDSPWRIFKLSGEAVPAVDLATIESIVSELESSLNSFGAMFRGYEDWNFGQFQLAFGAFSERMSLEACFDEVIPDTDLEAFLYQTRGNLARDSGKRLSLLDKWKLARAFRKDFNQKARGNTIRMTEQLSEARELLRKLDMNESKRNRNLAQNESLLPFLGRFSRVATSLKVSSDTELKKLVQSFTRVQDELHDSAYSLIWQGCDKLLQENNIAFLADTLFGSGLTLEQCKSLIIAAGAKRVIPELLNGSEILQLVNPSKASSEFVVEDRYFIDGNAQYVARQVGELALSAKLEFSEDFHTFESNAKKKRNQISTRDLFHEIPEVILGLTPCVAMSPLLVSSILPRRQLFDVVIFDEASQVLPIHAIPSIARGSQLVVAGDRLQLPPTTFFGKSTSAADSVEVNDFDSILDLLSPRMRNCWLLWHYRSQDERLIAVSNEFVYAKNGESLTTFPGANRSDTLKFIKVDSPAQTLRSTDQSSSDEIRVVVEEVLNHAKNFPKQSLGVIAFGAEHANRLDAAIRIAAGKRPETRSFFDENKTEPFFVKNLERVQGDERDRIIITTGYQKNASGRLPQNFGPINQVGGHRRVNVAISRAKQAMTLISSFGSEDIEIANAKDGVAILHGFFVFMESGGEQLLTVSNEEIVQNPFEYAIFERLTEEGLLIQPQFGVSGYKIDFAVQHPKKPGKFVLAIEADGATYHSSNSARDRDRLRQEHLERLGWVFHRIWSTDWFKNPNREIKKVLASYEAALGRKAAALDNKAPTLKQIERIKEDERVPPKRFAFGGTPIDQVPESLIEGLMEWVLASGELLSRDEAVERAFLITGYTKRGARILRELGDAYDIVS